MFIFKLSFISVWQYYIIDTVTLLVLQHMLKYYVGKFTSEWEGEWRAPLHPAPRLLICSPRCLIFRKGSHSSNISKSFTRFWDHEPVYW